MAAHAPPRLRHCDTKCSLRSLGGAPQKRLTRSPNCGDLGYCYCGEKHFWKVSRSTIRSFVLYHAVAGTEGGRGSHVTPPLYLCYVANRMNFFCGPPFKKFPFLCYVKGKFVPWPQIGILSPTLFSNFFFASYRIFESKFGPEANNIRLCV